MLIADEEGCSLLVSGLTLVMFVSSNRVMLGWNCEADFEVEVGGAGGVEWGNWGLSLVENLLLKFGWDFEAELNLGYD